MLDVTQRANHRPGRDTGSWLDIGQETNTITCYPRGKERQYRTGQQDNLDGSGEGMISPRTAAHR